MTLEADNLRLSMLCDSLQAANIRLIKENASLRQELNTLNKRLLQELPKARVCADCESVFADKETARYCPECRKRRHREAAKKLGLYRLGHEAIRRRIDETF